MSFGVYEAGVPANPPWAQVLDGIAAAGYAGTELGPYGYLPTNAEDLRRELAARHLNLGSSFVPLPLPAGPIDAAMQVGRLLSTLGVRQIILADAGRADPEARWSDSDWRVAAATLHAAADAVAELGLGVVIHHHLATWIERADEIDRLMAETDPARVGLLLDTGHAFRAGADPLAVLRRHGPRVRYVHLKDVDARGDWCALGDGVVPLPAILDELRRLGYQGWLIVEQDSAPDPARDIARSRRWLREVCGL